MKSSLYLFSLLIGILLLISKIQAQSVVLSEISTPDIRFCTLNIFQVGLHNTTSSPITFNLDITLDNQHLTSNVLFDDNNSPVFSLSGCASFNPVVYSPPTRFARLQILSLPAFTTCTLSFKVVPMPSVISPTPINLTNRYEITSLGTQLTTFVYNAIYPESKVICANQVSDTVTTVGQTFLREVTLFNSCVTDTMDKPMKFIDVRNDTGCVGIIEVGYNDTVYHTLLTFGNIIHGIGTDTFQITSALIDTIAAAEGLPNGKFCPLRDLKLVLTYKVTCCFNQDILCNYRTSWACGTADAPIYESPLVSNFPSPCASGTLRVHPNFSYPQLNVSARMKDMNFCYGPNQLSYDTLRIINKNSPAPTDTARNVLVELRQIGANGYTDIIDSTFQIRLNNGSPVPLSPDSMTDLYISCNNDSCFRRIYFSRSNINPRDTIFITWRTRTCSPDDCNIDPVKDSWGYKLTYDGQCGAKSSGVQDIPLFISQTVGKMVTDFNGPFDISDTVVNNVAVDLSNVSVWPAGDSLPFPERLLVKITLGQDLQFVPNTGNIGNLHILLPDLPLTCQNLFPVNDSLTPCDTASPSILYATFDVSDTTCFNSAGLNLLELHNGMLYFSFKGLCSGPCTAGNALPQDNIDTKLYYVPDTTCTPQPLLLIGCNNVNVQLHCPGCIRKGIHSLTYDIHRTTFGFMDCDNDNRWDGDSGCQPQAITEAFALVHPEIKIRRAMVGDVLKGTLTTLVVNNNSAYGPSDTLVFPYAYWVSKVRNGYGLNFGPDGNYPTSGFRLKPMDIILVFSPTDSSDTLLSNGPVTIVIPDSVLYITVDSSTNAIYHLDFSISVLNTYYNDSLNGYAYGSLPFSNFYDGLAISLTHRFRVQGNVVTDLDCEVASTIYLGEQPENSTFNQLIDPDPIFSDTTIFPNQPTTPADYDTYCDSLPAVCDQFQWYCSHQGGRFKLIGWAFYDFGVGDVFPPLPNGIDTVYQQCGGLGAPKTLSLIIGTQVTPNSGTNVFRFEYRNWVNVHKLKWDIPTGYIPASTMPYTQYFNLNGNGSTAPTVLDTSRFDLDNDSIVLHYTYIDSVYQNGVDPNISPCTNASCASTNFGSIVKPDDEFRVDPSFNFLPGCSVPDTTKADFYQEMDFIPSGGSTNLLDSEPWGFYGDTVFISHFSTLFDTTTYSRHDSITYIYDQHNRPEFAINANSFYNGYHSPECVTFSIHNTQTSSHGDATHAWFALHTDSCVSIDSITMDSVVHANPVADSLYYFSGAFLHNTSRNITICFNYNCTAGCNAHRNIYLFTGWDCNRTNSTVATLKQYNDTLGCPPKLDTIEVRPSNAEFNATLTSSTTSPTVCDTIEYNLKVASTSFGSEYHIVVTDTLPCSTMTYLLNSTQFIFATDTINAEPDTSSSGGAQILTWNIDSISAYILANGLEGSAFDSLHSVFVIHYKIKTGCGACLQQRGIAHIDYVTNCSDTEMWRRNFNPLVDSTNALFNDLSDTLTVDTLNACNNRYGVIVALYNNNNSTALDSNNYLEVTIPAGFTTDSFNISPDTVIGHLLRWQLDSLSSITFQLALDTALCGSHNIIANLFARDTLSCGSGSCIINELASTDTISFTVPSPDSVFICPSDTVLCHEPVQFTPEGLCGYFVWDFGDSTTSNALAPTHFYDTAGTYTVTLTVYGNGSSPAGCSASSTCTVVVECPERLCGGFSTYKPNMWTKGNSCTNIPNQVDSNRCQGNYAVHYLMTSSHFSNTFPAPYGLVVGDTISSAMKFTTASAVRCYLKNCGGTPSPSGLSNSIPVSTVLTDPNCPTCGCANPIIQEVLALKLAVYFDFADTNFISSPYHLAYLRIVGVPAQTLIGYTVMQVLNLADSVIAQGTSPLAPHSMTLQDFYTLIRTINTSMNQCSPPNPHMYDCVPNGPLHIMMQPEDGNCLNGSSANIAAFAVGGIPPFHYLWSTGDSSLVISGLSDGIYTITITDNDGTIATAEATVTTSGDICCSNSANEFPQYPDSFNVSADSSYNVNFLPYVPIEFYESLTLTHNVLHMMEGVQLIVESGTTLILDSCELSACGNMWKGIVVKDGGTLRVVNGSIIKDAERAIYGENGSKVYIYGSYFENNIVGFETAENYADAINDIDFIVAATTFDFTGTLQDAYPGQTPYSTKPKAGILFHNMLGTIGGDDKAAENTFANMNCGIISYSSVLSVKNSKFRNVQNDTFYPEEFMGSAIAAVGDKALYSAIDVSPYVGQDTANATFLSCDYGVFTENGIDVSIASCFMDSMITGVYIQGNQDKYQVDIDSNNISAYTAGINFYSNEGVDLLYAGHNYITTTGYKGICIVASESGSGENNLVIEENTLTCDGSKGGIDLSGCYASVVYHNTVDQITSISTGGFNGVNLTGCTEPNASCNIINGLTDDNDVGTIGISVSVTDDAILHCNSTNLTTYGIAFFGLCPTEDNIKDNEMNIHKVGLHLNSNAIISEQKHCGNLWLGSFSSGYGANNLNVGGGISVTASQFYVHEDSVTDYYPSIPDYDSTWFQVDETGEPYSCADESECPDGGSEMSMSTRPESLDNSIANDHTLSIDFIPETKSMARQFLFKRLTNIPGLLDSSSALSDFYTLYSDSSVRALQGVRDSIFGMRNYDEYYSNSCRTIDSSMKALADSITILDSLMNNDPLNASTYVSQKTNLRVVANILQGNMLSLRAQMRSILTSKVSSAISANSAITSQHIPESNEQTINDIYLETVAVGNFVLDGGQTSTVLNIAQQCPYAGGKAVYRARTLYKLIDASIKYNDDSICFVAGVSRMENQSSKENIEEGTIRLIPNPANDNVTVIYQPSSDGTCELYLSDITGKVVKQISVPCDKKRFTFSISDVKSGLYLVNVINGNHSIGRSKFAIIR